MEMELCKLFIGGISWETNDDRLRQYFETFGEVSEAVIMRDRTTGRARGFGFVVFADPAVAERVLLQKHVIDGRVVEAKKAVPRDDQSILNKPNSSVYGSPGPVRTKKIFVGGLASSVTESEFKRYFDQFGLITDVVVMYDHKTQRPRGFGFITYDSEESVDLVLQNTFHELHGKMVEVKQAVPKEASPGFNRNQFGGYSNSISRIGSFLNEYTQGHSANLVRGYGARTDGRYSPATVGRAGFSPFGLGSGNELNFEPNLIPSYAGTSNLSSNLSHGRALSPSYTANLNRYGSPFGFTGPSGGTGSVLNSMSKNIWGHGSCQYGPNPSVSGAFTSSQTENPLVASSLGSIGAHLVSSNKRYLGHRDEGFGIESGMEFIRRKETGLAPEPSNLVSNGGYMGSLPDTFGSDSFYGDSIWNSSHSELPKSHSFGFEFGPSDLMTKSSVAYVGGYGVASRQQNGGIAA